MEFYKYLYILARLAFKASSIYFKLLFLRKVTYTHTYIWNEKVTSIQKFRIIYFIILKMILERIYEKYFIQSLNLDIFLTKYISIKIYFIYIL